jgi:hypothetical protein
MTNRAGRPAVHGAKRGVEPADAREAGGERDRRHRQGGLVDQGFRALHAPGRRDGGRGGAGVAPEQATQMSGRHAERVGKIVDGPGVVEEPALDEAQRARDARGRPVPRRCAGRGLGSTSQARAEARALGGGRGGEEDDVA